MSTTEQVKERVGEGAQQIQQKASEAKSQTRERVREQIDTRSTQTGEQMTGAASALRQTAERLRGEGQASQASLIDQIAQRADQIGRYLTQTDGDHMLRDVERVARRQPWLVAAAGALMGFVGARFMKASSTNRYEANGYGRPALPPGSDRGDF
jgi:hypothetical protein